MYEQKKEWKWKIKNEMEIKTCALNEPTTNQIQNSNFKNQRLVARHPFTTNQMQMLFPASIIPGAPLKGK